MAMLDFVYGTFDGTIASTGVPSGVAITATRDSTNVLDLGVARDLGAGAPLGIHVYVTQTFLTLTSLQISFKVSADNSTYFDILDSPVIPVAQLIASSEKVFRYTWPLNQVLNAAAGILKAPGRYAKLVYTVAGSNATAGAVFSYAGPELDRDAFTGYAINYSVAATAAQLA